MGSATEVASGELAAHGGSVVSGGRAMAQGVAFIEGKFVPAQEARISIFDTGFTRGDAVYDTVSVWKGRFFRLDDHVARFLRSCAGMRLSCPHAPEEIKWILAACVHRAQIQDAYVQMIVTRGVLPRTPLRDPRLCQNQFIGYAIPYVWIIPPEQQATGINLVVCRTRRTPPEAIDPRVKNYNWMDLSRGLLEALEQGGATGILCAMDGRLTEGPGFNLFIVTRGELRTPRANVLEGITRQTVFDLAAEAGVAAHPADLTPEDLRQADEVFLSSTAGGIMPVSQVDGQPVASGTPGPLTGRLRALYWERRDQGWLGTAVEELIKRTPVGLSDHCA
jgi:branched-chain amino acid aminotransferase